MNLLSTIIFILITSITPGPNNISSFVFSLKYSYRGTIKYMLGICFGTMFILTLCGFLVESIQQHLTFVTPFLKYLAAAYIIYLAYKSYKLNVVSATDKDEDKAPTFFNGFILQLVNPKAIFFGLTLYSSFLVSFTKSATGILSTSLTIPFITYLAVSVWALLGSIILNYLKNKTLLKGISIVMALLLVFFAISIVV